MDLRAGSWVAVCKKRESDLPRLGSGAHVEHMALARGLREGRRMSAAASIVARTDSPKCVLLIVEDAPLAELLAEALFEAGHVAQMATISEIVDGEEASQIFDAALVDLDSWDRRGAPAIAELRRRDPTTLIVALLPCGSVASEFAGVQYHLALEKPARIQSVLVAIQTSVPRPRRI